MKISLRVAFWSLLITVASRAAEEEGAVQPALPPPTIRETQMTFRIGLTQFQATVIEKKGLTLTLLTSAHCLSLNDVSKTIGISWSGDRLHGRIAAVSQNPSYHPVRSRDRRDPSVRDIVGVDNAIVTVVVDPGSEGDERICQKIKPADMRLQATLGGSRQIFHIHIVDQFGEEHILRAGTHLNAKCLAWGHRSYRVKPGDSGAGVFLLRMTPEGKTWPILIGNVSLTDERGGIAPLVSREDRWVERAIACQKCHEEKL